jgi:hypothetical protein
MTVAVVAHEHGDTQWQVAMWFRRKFGTGRDGQVFAQLYSALAAEGVEVLTIRVASLMIHG